jgi:hypothetical protein
MFMYFNCHISIFSPYNDLFFKINKNKYSLNMIFLIKMETF